MEERTRTVLDFTSIVDLKEALSEAFEGKKRDVVLRDSAARKLSAVQLGCFGEERCSPTTVSNIHDVRIILQLVDGVVVVADLCP